MQSSRGSLALAFSGGLDTSYCVPRLAEDGWAVHTVYVDTGGSTFEERAAIRRQASAVGAASHQEIDARDQVFDRFVRFLVQACSNVYDNAVSNVRDDAYLQPHTTSNHYQDISVRRVIAELVDDPAWPEVTATEAGEAELLDFGTGRRERVPRASGFRGDG